MTTAGGFFVAFRDKRGVLDDKITANAIVFFFVHKKNTDIISATGKTLRRLFPSAKKY